MVLLRYAKALLSCLIFCSILPVFATVQEMEVIYTSELANTRHPLVGYWFITPDS